MSANLNIGIILEAIDRATGPIRRVMAQMDRIAAPAKRVSQAVGNVTREAGALGLRFAALGGGLGYLFKTQLLDTAAAFERFRTVLETTEGSAEAARRAMGWVSDFATTTPYELDQVTAAYVKLRAFGLDPTNGLLRTLGDTSAAMGTDINQAVEAIADAVTGENERLKEFGITARTIGKKIVYEYAINGKQMRAVAQRGNRAMIEETLTAIWNEKYGGAMDKLSRTWGGLMSNLSDQWTRFANLVMDAGAFDFMKGQLSGLLDTVNAMAANGELQRLAEDFGLRLVDGLKATAVAARALAEILVTLGGWVSWLADLLGGWRNLMIAVAGVMSVKLATALLGLIGALNALGVTILATPLGWFLAALAAIVAAGVLVWRNWDWLSAKAAELWDRFGNLVALIPGFGGLIFVAKQIAENWETIVGLFADAWDWIGKIGGAWDSLFGGGSAAPTAPPARIAGRPGAGAPSRGEVAIRFDNPPRGMRVERAKSSGDLDLAVEQGLVMGGGW